MIMRRNRDIAMNNAKIMFAALLAAAVVTGCASHPDPIIDMKGVDPVAMQDDWDECEEYSNEVIVAKPMSSPSASRYCAGGFA